MIDFKIKNGDVVVDSAGRLIRLSDKDALFQRAVICMSARYGEFIYNRGLGSHATEINADDEDYIKKLELVLNEALAEFDNSYVRVIECGQTIITELTIDGESRTEEVLLVGSL